MAEHLVDHSKLRTFISTILGKEGLSQSHAEIVADVLIDADLRGIRTHGVAKLPQYLNRLNEGGLNPAPNIQVVETRPATAIVNGDHGPGHIATLRAIETAVSLTNDAGCGFVSVKNSNHFGTASYYTNYAAQRDCVGICMTHAGQNVAPFGGSEPYLGTNPISIALPRKGEFPITLDMSTSVKAKGAINQARINDTEIPPEWAVDESGEPTTDPEEVHALRPMGGPKGYGLAFIIEALCGVLMNTVFGKRVPSLPDNPSSSQQLSHFVGAIDVAAFTDLHEFVTRLNQFSEEVKEVPPAAGFDSVLLPGEPEAISKREALNKGIPFIEEEWEVITEIASQQGIDIPSTS